MYVYIYIYGYTIQYNIPKKEKHIDTITYNVCISLYIYYHYIWNFLVELFGAGFILKAWQLKLNTLAKAKLAASYSRRFGHQTRLAGKSSNLPSGKLT